jgi:hypothetical protein
VNFFDELDAVVTTELKPSIVQPGVSPEAQDGAIEIG